MNYQNYLQSTGPSWQQRPNAAAYMGALGATLDTTIAQYKAGIKLACPGIAGSLADDLALSYLGDEMGLPRSITETSAAYGERLRQAWSIWPWAGTAVGMLLILYQSGFDRPLLVQQNGLGYQITSTPVLPLDGITGLPSWVTRTVLGNNNPAIPASTDGHAAIPVGTKPWFMFDRGMDANGNQFTSRFELIFDVTAGVANPALGGTASNLTRLRQLVAAWKPGKATCLGFSVVTSGLWWGKPGLVWGAGSGNWGGIVSVYGA